MLNSGCRVSFRVVSVFALCFMFSPLLHSQTKAHQSLNFDVISKLHVGESKTIKATASSGLPLSYQSLSPDVCAVSTNNVMAKISGVCTLNADQADDSAYFPVSAKLSIPVAKQSQSISFIANQQWLVGVAGEFAATASSGLPVVLTVLSQDICRLQRGILEGRRQGDCVLVAKQAGNTQYAAVKTKQVYKISKLDQQILFDALPVLLANQGVTVAVTTSSGLPVKLVSTTPDFCQVDANTVMGVKAGVCRITALQSGNEQYNPAQSVAQSGVVISSYLNTAYSTVSSFLKDYQAGKLVAGRYQVGQRSYIFDGVTLKPNNGLWAKLVTKRPKVAVFGNSIITLGDQMPLWSNNAWSNRDFYYPGANGTGYLNWFLALSNDAFEFVHSKQKDFGVQSGINKNHAVLDSYGVFSYAGANMANIKANNGSMWPYLLEVLHRYVEPPDIIFLSNLFENDIGAAAFSFFQLKVETLEWLQAIRAVYPNVGIIIDTPNPSLYYALGGNAQTYYDLTRWLQTLPDQYDWIYTDANFCCSETPGSANPNPDLSMLRANDGIHPVERGALKRAVFRSQQLGFLFPNARGKMVAEYDPFNQDNIYYQQNADYVQLGMPGIAFHGETFTNYEFMPDAGFDANVVKAADGRGIVATVFRSSAGTGIGKLVVANDLGIRPGINPEDTFVQLARLKVINPAHIQMLGMEISFDNSLGQLAHVVSETDVTPNNNGGYNGIADIIQSGTELTLVSKPFSPSRFKNLAWLNAVYSAQLTIKLDADTPVFTTDCADCPQVQLIAQNLLKVKSLK